MLSCHSSIDPGRETPVINSINHWNILWASSITQIAHRWIAFGALLNLFEGGCVQSIGPVQLFLTCWTLFHVWDAITRKPNRPTAPNIHPIIEIPLNPYPLRSCDHNWHKKKRKIKHCHLRRRHAMRAGTARSTRTELLETATKDPHVGPTP